MSDKTKTSFLKRFGLVVLTIFLLALFGAALLPTLASTQWGHNRLLDLVNHNIPGSIELKDANLSWFGSQELRGIQLKDPQGKVVLTVDKFTTDATLFELLRNEFSNGSAEIAGLNANLTEEQHGLTNLQRALGHDPLPLDKDKTALPHTPFTIALMNVNATMNLDTTGPKTIHLIGHTKQEQLDGVFDIDVVLNGMDITHGLDLKDDSDVALKVNVSNFPVALIDHIIAIHNPQLAGIAQAGLGKTLDVVANKEISQSEITFDVQAKTETLSANLIGKVHGDTLSLSQPGEGTLTVTPEFINFLTKAALLPEGFSLLNSTQATIKVRDLLIPLKNWDVSTNAEVTFPKAEFVLPNFKSPITLNQTRITILAPATARNVVIAINGETVLSRNSMPIHLEATLSKPIQWDKLGEQIKNQLELEVQVDHVPMGILDQQLELNGALVKYIGKQASIELHASLNDKSTELQFALDGELLSLSNLHFYHEGHKWELDTHLETESKSPLASIIGDSTKLQVQAEDGVVEASFSSLVGSARIAGKLSDNFIFRMTEPAITQFHLSPLLAETLGLDKAGVVKLNKPTSVVLKIEPIKQAIDLRNLNLEKITSLVIAGQLQAEEIQLSSIDPYSNADSVIVRNLFAPWVIDFPGNRINVSLKGDTQLTGKSNGMVQGDVTLNNWWQRDHLDLANASVNAKLGIKNVPVILLGALVGEDDLVGVLGKTLDIDLVYYTQSNKNTLELDLKGDNLKGKIALNIGDTISLKNSQPIVLNLVLTPERFHALRRLFSNNNPDTLALIEPTQVNATISMLQMPGLKGHSPLAQLGIKANVSISSLKLIDTNQRQNLALENIVANIDSQNINRQIQFSMNAKDRSLGGAGGDLIVNGVVENALTDKGEVDLQRMSVNLFAKSNHLPAGLICQMACNDASMRNKVEALLGSTIDTDIHVQLQRMNGPVQMNLRGANGRVTIDARVQDGFVTLTRPLEVEVAVTRELSNSILQDIIPILSGAITADNPIKITVDPQGFAIPLRDPDIANMQIGRAVIELGRMQFSNSGELASVLALLKPSSDHLLSVWFTPLYVQMQNGNIHVQRMDMLLLDKFPIAIWGNVNVPRDNVDLKIGITGTAIGHAMNLPNLDKKYMLQLPFRGHIGSASIDRNQATARITALVAQSQGGPHGAILGTVLDIAGGGLTETSPPSPTTNPLPWADSTQVANTETKTESNPVSSPVHHVEKAATKLIKSLFK